MELLDPAEDEDVVVHREAEEDDEEEQRQPAHDRAVRLEAEHARAPAVLEDGDEDPVGGADREQVQRDRRRGDHERPEREQQQHEREPEHEQEDVRQPRAHLVVEVVRAGGHAGHRHLGVGQRRRDRRDHGVAQRVQRRERGRVVAVAGDREVDPRDRPVRVER